jgi:hypothetical protein
LLVGLVEYAANAIVRPSGDQAGPVANETRLSVTRRSCRPLGSTTWIAAPPRENAILPFRPGKAERAGGAGSTTTARQTPGTSSARLRRLHVEDSVTP